jgi:hypothetical protein
MDLVIAVGRLAAELSSARIHYCNVSYKRRWQRGISFPPANKRRTSSVRWKKLSAHLVLPKMTEEVSRKWEKDVPQSCQDRVLNSPDGSAAPTSRRGIYTAIRD